MGIGVTGHHFDPSASRRSPFPLARRGIDRTTAGIDNIVLCTID